MLRWWSALSGESKAAIIAAIVGPITVSLLGIGPRMMRIFYIRTFEKLSAAREQLSKNSKAKLPAGINDNANYDAFYSIEAVAKKAGVSLFWARRAIRWEDRIKKYGRLMH